MRLKLPLSALARKSLADVTRRKGRTLLVVLGILIGVGGLTAINVADSSIANAFAYSSDETATPNIFLSVNSVEPSALAAVRAVPNVQVAQVATYYHTRWAIAAAPGHANITVIAYQNLADVALDPFRVTSGRLPSGSDEIVMESSDRELQGFHVGDSITLETAHGERRLTVVGLSRTLGQASATFNNRAQAYMSAAGVSALSGAAGYNTVEAQVRDMGTATATAAALEDTLKRQGVTVQGVSIEGNQFEPGPLTGVFTIMRVLSLIALLLTSFLILNTVTTLVAEQTKVIGTMKALGATRSTVMRGYLTSVGVYALFGSAVGIAFGIYGGYQFAHYLTTIIILDLGPFSLDPGIVAVSLLVGLAIPFAAAILPLLNGTGITVREAMQGYGVSAGAAARGAKRGRVARRLTWVSQTTWLGMRGLFRRRGRAILTLLALTLSGTAFLAIQTTTYSVNSFIGQLFSQYGFDAYVGTTPQHYDMIKQKLLAIPNVARVERFEQDGLDTRYGLMILTGVEPDTQLYHHQLLAGRWFNGDEPGSLLISDLMAQRTGLRVGDTISFSNLTTEFTYQIIGEVHDDNDSIGSIGVAVTTVNDLHNFEGAAPDMAGSFILGSRDHSTAAVDALATRIDETLSADGLSPSVSTSQQQIQRNDNEFQILYILLYAVAFIVALVGVLGLFNTLTTSVLERRREIGILRSMGATGWRVAGVFWTEGMALAGISWVVAALVGIPCAYAFLALINAVLVPVSFAFSPVSLVAMLVVIAAIATVASFLPAMSAARVRIAETLRYE